LLAYALALAIQIVFNQFVLIILLVPALLWMGGAFQTVDPVKGTGEATARQPYTAIGNYTIKDGSPFLPILTNDV